MNESQFLYIRVMWHDSWMTWIHFRFHGHHTSWSFLSPSLHSEFNNRSLLQKSPIIEPYEWREFISEFMVITRHEALSHSLFTLSPLSPTLFTHSCSTPSLSLHTLSTLSPLSLHSLFTLSPFSLHSLSTLSSLSLHSFFFLSSLSLHSLVCVCCSLFCEENAFPIREWVIMPHGSYSLSYGVATISRIDKIIGLFCKRAL